MNKYLLSLALIGFSSVCLSAAKIPSTQGKQVAMARCTKAEKVKEEKKEEPKQEEACYENGRKTKKQAWDVRNGYSQNGYKAKKGDVAAARKSAARKILDGE